MQAALALRSRQRIAWQSEVVHADVGIALAQEAADRPLQHRHPVFRRWQVGGIDPALGLEPRRQMRIGIERDAIGAQLSYLGDGAREGLGRLLGQPVDQVGVDGLVAQLSGAAHQIAHAVVGLNAVHRLLHLGVKVLHAEARPVESQAAPGGQALWGGGAWIHLDGGFRPGGQAESLLQHGHHPRQLVIAEEGGGAAAEVQLRHALPCPQRLGVQVDFDLQCVQVLGGPLMVAGDDLVACAVVAHRFAERDVHIDGQRLLAAHHGPFGALRQRPLVISGGEGFHEAVSRRVRGVPGARNIEASQKLNRKGRRALGLDIGHGRMVPNTPDPDLIWLKTGSRCQFKNTLPLENDHVPTWPARPRLAPVRHRQARHNSPHD